MQPPFTDCNFSPDWPNGRENWDPWAVNGTVSCATRERRIAPILDTHCAAAGWWMSVRNFVRRSRLFWRTYVWWLVMWQCFYTVHYRVLCVLLFLLCNSANRAFGESCNTFVCVHPIKKVFTDDSIGESNTKFYCGICEVLLITM